MTDTKLVLHSDAYHSDTEFVSHSDTEFVSHSDTEFVSHSDAKFVSHLVAAFVSHLVASFVSHLVAAFVSGSKYDSTSTERLLSPKSDSGVSICEVCIFCAPLCELPAASVADACVSYRLVLQRRSGAGAGLSLAALALASAGRGCSAAIEKEARTSLFRSSSGPEQEGRQKSRAHEVATADEDHKGALRKDTLRTGACTCEKGPMHKGEYEVGTAGKFGR